MMAIPNYARMNRVALPVEYLGDTNVNYAPGASTSAPQQSPGRAAAPVTAAIAVPNTGACNRSAMKAESKVWI
jgi:hypothetical protein